MAIRSFEGAVDAVGTVTVTVIASDDGGTDNGGIDTAEPQTFTITIDPRQAHKPVAYKHEGEEFILVMEGALELTLGGKTHHLKPGESSHFNSEIPHKLKNLSDEPTQCVVVLYTP